MSYRYLLLIVGVATSSLLIVGTASALRTQQDSQEILKQVVLQKADFPPNVEAYTFSSDEAKVEDFNEQLSFVTKPFQAEGFVDAYRVNSWYTLSFEDGTFKEFNQGAFVENIAYLFQNQAQATNAFEQQIDQFNRDRPTQENTTIKDIQVDNLQGKVIQIDYTDGETNFTGYYLLGVVDNRLLFLMVDGLPDPAVQKVFDSLMTKLVSYQSAG